MRNTIASSPNPRPNSRKPNASSLSLMRHTPMYNEVEGIGEFVRQAHVAVDPLAVDRERIAVNDGSTDASLANASMAHLSPTLAHGHDRR